MKGEGRSVNPEGLASNGERTGRGERTWHERAEGRQVGTGQVRRSSCKATRRETAWSKSRRNVGGAVQLGRRRVEAPSAGPPLSKVRRAARRAQEGQPPHALLQSPRPRTVAARISLAFIRACAPASAASLYPVPGQGLASCSSWEPDCLAQGTKRARGKCFLPEGTRVHE